jgi:hypothetical protein
MAQAPLPERATDRDSVRTWQYAFASTLLTYVPLLVLTDLKGWKIIVASVALSLGLYVFIDWLRSTARQPDSRDRWRR